MRHPRIDRWTVLLAAIGALGAALVLLRTAPYGPGAGWDSAGFVSTAHNLLAGGGFTMFDGSPYFRDAVPGFPLALALAGLFGPDPYDAAGYINAAAFGLTAFATAAWVRSRTGSRLLAIWAGLACALSPALGASAATVMTEPLFVLFAVLSLYALDRRLAGGGRSLLLAAAACAALACATRYLGLALAASGAALLLAHRGGALPVRVRDASIFAGAALAPAAAWWARNLAAFGEPARSLSPTGSYPLIDLQTATGEFARWTLGEGGFAVLGGVSGAFGAPLDGEASLGAVLVEAAALLALAAGAAALLAGARRAPGGAAGWALPAAFLACCALMLAVALPRSDAALYPRYLLPMYPPLLVVAAIALAELRRRALMRGRVPRLPSRLLRGLGGASASLPALALAAALALWLAQQAGATANDVRDWRAEGWGAGFRNEFWASSETARYLRERPPDGPVWSTISAALVVASGLRTEQRGVDSRLSVVAERTAEARAAGEDARIVWFHWGYKPQFFGLEDLAALPGLELEALFEDGAVFRLAADPAARAASPAATLLEGARPLARSIFDVYLDEARNRLVYVREECGEAGGAAPFFLRVHPVDETSLSAGDRERGLADLGFRFDRHGFRDGERCLAARSLPDWGVRGVRTGQWVPDAGELWSVRGLVLGDPDAASIDADAVRARAEPIADAPFEVYLDGGRLVYVRDGCEADADATARFFLHVFPADPENLPGDRRNSGFVNLDFWFDEAGAIGGGRCVAARSLPRWDIAEVRTGQWAPGTGSLWEAGAVVGGAPLSREAAADLDALLARARPLGGPPGGAPFEVHLDGGRLLYVRESCEAGDAALSDPFFLHVAPSDRADLPEDRRESGFDNLDFEFGVYGAAEDGRCVAVRALPTYRIASLRTGQWVRGEGEVWALEAAFGGDPPPEADAGLGALLAGARPLGGPPGGAPFEVHLSDGRLLYVRENCEAGDPVLSDPFFLHVAPSDPADLPEDRRGSGFDNLDFEFGAYGSAEGGRCVAVRDLPAYRIASIRTGQWVRGEGEAWAVEAAFGE